MYIDVPHAKPMPDSDESSSKWEISDDDIDRNAIDIIDK